MGEASKIEWTDATWNPVVGCQKISPGCANCYAKEQHDRRHAAFLAGKDMPIQYAEPFEVIQLKPERLEAPLRWKRPRRIFVNSVSDLFHEDVPDGFIAQVFAVMESAYWHTFQVLTKRSERLLKLLGDERFPMLVRKMGYDWLGPKKYMERGPHWRMNQWLGVSVENKKHGLPRIEQLRTTPAEIRFLSIEPLLEDLGPLNLTGIHWVIVGGESGHHARPFAIDWARDILRQCRAQGVACFVKQFGATPRALTGTGVAEILTLNSSKGNDPDEWPEDLRVREFPQVPA